MHITPQKTIYLDAVNAAFAIKMSNFRRNEHLKMMDHDKKHKMVIIGNRTHVAGNAKKGQPNRKQKARLDRRVFDYNAMISNKDFKGEVGAFHRPGSMQ